MFARSGAIVSGLVLLAAAGMLALTGDRAGVYLQNLVHRSLETIFIESEPTLEIVQTARSAFFQILPFLTTVFAAGLLGALVPAIVARKNRGRTAVPLPKFPKNRIALTAIRTAGATLFTLLALYIFREQVGSVWRVLQGDLSAINELFVALCQLLAGGGAVLVLLGMAEIAIIRHGVWRTLFLNKMEAKRESREAGGDSEVKSRQRRRAAKGIRG
jgi:flagellar biosynthesis protein FlhB